jgi:hypothetical protein
VEKLSRCDRSLRDGRAHIYMLGVGQVQASFGRFDSDQSLVVRVKVGFHDDVGAVG